MKNQFDIFLLILFLGLYSCQEPAGSMVIKGGTIDVDSLQIAEIDSTQWQIISKYTEKLDEDMNRVLVYSEHAMEKGSPEGKLNNFVADLVLYFGNQLYHSKDNKSIDFCLLNYGGLREALPQGEITHARVFEMLPFENEMIVLTLESQYVEELFDYLARANTGMPVSGLRLIIKNKKPVDVLIQGETFDPSRNYKILTSDYLASGGDNMVFLTKPLEFEMLGMKVRDAIIKHMEDTHAKGEMISAQLDGRISYTH
jgi:2',3'-cyclic-nucleotide 2'-phosphodiesterase (5'-nucleotidase family)